MTETLGGFTVYTDPDGTTGRDCTTPPCLACVTPVFECEDCGYTDPLEVTITMPSAIETEMPVDPPTIARDADNLCKWSTQFTLSNPVSHNGAIIAAVKLTFTLTKTNNTFKAVLIDSSGAEAQTVDYSNSLVFSICRDQLRVGGGHSLAIDTATTGWGATVSLTP